MFKISDLRCEFTSNPLGIDVPQPRFSWLLDHPKRGQAQTAYQIMVASSPQALQDNKADLWDSGKTPTSAAPLISYDGRPLASRQRAYWKVRVWDAQDQPSSYADSAWFEMGLLTPTDWHAEWIGFPAAWGGRGLYFRDAFEITQPILQARVYVCGLGFYELHLNGQKVGQRVLDPAQTDYTKRILYTTYDIQPLLQPGLNVIGAMVGNGWYGTPKLLLQAEIQFTNGSTTQVVTGKHGSGGSWWRVTSGAIIQNSLFDGEVYDARLEKNGWDTPEGFNKDFPNVDDWAGAMVVEAPGGRLTAQLLEAIEVIETRKAVKIEQPKTGVYVLDIGQNLAGWAVLQAEGDAGTTLTLRYGESLNADGTVNQQNLRSAIACDRYILKGGGLERWEPRFTYHGFRYIQVEGFPGVPTEESLQVQVVRSAVQASGHFTCDNRLINQLHQAIWWTEASNLHGIPTDCPQRDERMGWLNDMAARSEEALHNFALSRLLPKWMNDIADTQDVSGAIADTAPYRWGNRPADPVSVAYVLIPWLLYHHYGDYQVLHHHYGGMKGWVDYLTSRAPDNIVDYSYYGDWAAPRSETIQGSLGTSAVSRHTPGGLVSTALYHYAVSLLSQIARLLGRNQDAATYAGLADRISEAFNAHFWDESQGGYGSNNQACNALALYMELVSEGRKATVLANLIRDIEQHDYHLTTGNLCTKYILEVLTIAGQGELAMKLVTQTSYPSWGYMLEQGATTIWERWEQATGWGMNSHNHPMFGSVGAWFYRWLGGIQALPNEPAFRRFAIRPFLPKGLNRTQASLQTVRGLIESAWERTTQGYALHVSIPIGSQAEVTIPQDGNLTISEGGVCIWSNEQSVAQVEGMVAVHKDERAVRLTVGSGTYHFLIEEVLA